MIAMTGQRILKEYRAKTASTENILGFTHKGMVYAVHVKKIYPRYLKEDKASRGQGKSLRLNIVKEVKQSLLKTAFIVGTVKELTENGYNRGENFERLIYRYYKREWKKDNTKFTIAGDIQIDGKEIQIKFHRATITNEKTLKRAEG